MWSCRLTYPPYIDTVQQRLGLMLNMQQVSVYFKHCHITAQVWEPVLQLANYSHLPHGCAAPKNPVTSQLTERMVFFPQPAGDACSASAAAALPTQMHLSVCEVKDMSEGALKKGKGENWSESNSPVRKQNPPWWPPGLLRDNSSIHSNVL